MAKTASKDLELWELLQWQQNNKRVEAWRFAKRYTTKYNYWLMGNGMLCGIMYDINNLQSRV